MISLCTPTRNRLESLKLMMTSAMSHAGTPIEFVLYVDEDPATVEWLEDKRQRIEAPGHRLKVLTGTKRLLSQYWNDCAAESTGSVVMLANDDLVFLTPDWAKTVEDAFSILEQQLGMVHANNLQGNASTFATHPFVHRNWLSTLGYFTPPCFSGDWTDTWVDAVARLFAKADPTKDRVVYLPNVTIEHRHYSFGKSKLDQTYQERLDSEKDKASLYEDLWMLRQLAADMLQQVADQTKPLGANS